MIGVYELAVLGFLFVLFLPFILAFIDILKSNFEGNNKIIWLLAVIFPFYRGNCLFYYRQETEDCQIRVGKGKHD